MKPKKYKLKIITRYILKEFLITFLIAFLFFFVIFFINHILVNIEPLLQKSIPFHLVAMMLITFFPVIAIFSLPFGTMLATLMTMGRFSSDNEIIAFRALGFNFMKIFLPIFICGFIITVLTFIINDKLVPLSWHEQRITLRKIGQIKPTLDFKSKTVKKHEGKSIFTNIVNKADIQGLFIIDKDENNQKRIISAKDAEIITNKDQKGIIELKMNQSMVQFETKDRQNEFNYGYADSISYFIDLQEFYDDDPQNIPGTAKSTLENLRDINKFQEIMYANKNKLYGDLISMKEETYNLLNSYEQRLKNNLSKDDFEQNLIKTDNNINILTDLNKNFNKLRNDNLNSSLIEFYRKFANPLSCVIFVIFAGPIGIYSRRAGFQIGFILGLFLTAIYWFSFYGSIILSRKYILTPFFAMFLPNFFFLIIGLIFLYKRLTE